MLLRELIHQTIVLKDEARQRRTISLVGIKNMKEELREIESRWKNKLKEDGLRIIEETDFKELGLTTKDKRQDYIDKEQSEIRKDMMEETGDQKVLIELAEEREKEIYDEHKYYEDRLALLMKIYDIEGEIELEEVILEERKKIMEE